MDAFEKGMGHASKQVPPVTVESLPPLVEEAPSDRDGSISTTFQRWLAAAQRKPQLTAFTVVIGLALMGSLFWSIIGFEPPSSPTIRVTVVAGDPGAETVAAATDIPSPTDTPTPEEPKSPPVVEPTQTARPRPIHTPTPTRTPKRPPTPTPTPRLSVTINGRTSGSFNVGSEVEICFSSTGPTRAEAKLSYAGQSFDLDEFGRLGSKEECLSKTVDRPGKYSVKIIALDRSDKEVVSKSIDFDAINPLPDVFINIYRGQKCPGSCYDYGSQADFCVSSNFTTRARVNVYGPNNSSLFASLGDWNLNSKEQCVSGPMPVPQGRYNFEVRSLDNPAVSKSHQFDVCDCPGQ
jgi:hypothetical protein